MTEDDEEFEPQELTIMVSDSRQSVTLVILAGDRTIEMELGIPSTNKLIKGLQSAIRELRAAAKASAN